MLFTYCLNKMFGRFKKILVHEQCIRARGQRYDRMNQNCRQMCDQCQHQTPIRYRWTKVALKNLILIYVTPNHFIVCWILLEYCLWYSFFIAIWGLYMFIFMEKIHSFRLLRSKSRLWNNFIKIYTFFFALI